MKFFLNLLYLCCLPFALIVAKEKQASYTPVTVPNGTTLPWIMEDGCKTFHLTAEAISQSFLNSFRVDCLGYNGQTPGPVIEAVEGDKVRIYVTNHLSEPTTVHWHGFILPNGMDGVAGLTQPVIPPGKTFKYEFTLKQSGTYMYHPHFDSIVQIGKGLMGFFIVHPKKPESPLVDRDFVLFTHEWFIPSGTTIPDPTSMNNNYFTFNGKCFPLTDPLVVRLGQKVRIRFGNLSMDSHPIHIHGCAFRVTGAAVKIPESAQYEDITINIPSGNTRDIEFTAHAPGDWAVHCHKTHHTENGMVHGTSTSGGMQMKEPEKTMDTGMDGPFGKIALGGMSTIIKVRAGITSYGDPGWYKQPADTSVMPVEQSTLKVQNSFDE